MPRIAACGAPVAALDASVIRHSLGVQADQGLAGGDQVAVLDEPLDDVPPCGAVTAVSSRRLGDVADRGARRERVAVGRLGGLVEGALGGRDDHPPGRAWSRSASASPCLAQNARASSSWSGVLSANVSTPLSARLAMPVSVPAGGISRMPVTPRSAIVSMHRSQRTGLAIWPTIRRSTSRPSWTTWPSRLEISRVRGSWVETDAGQRGEVADGGRHVLGVERAGDAERDQPGLGRRVLGEGLRAARGCRRRRSGRGRCRWRR